MNIKLATSCLAIMTLLSPLSSFGEGSDTDRAHPITFIKDSVITTKVKAMLADEKMHSLTHISVDTDAKGAVTLSGRVHSQAEADKAVAITRGIEGVTSVRSDFQIRKED